MLRFAAAFVIAAVALSPAAPAAPARKPVSPPIPYVVKTASSLAELEKTLGGQGAHGADLVKPAGPMAVEVIWKREQDNTQELLESHDGRDHVFFVTDGKATFTLGGELEDPKEISPGEWRAPKAHGSKVMDLKKGDLVVIPHGTVHSRHTKGGAFTMLQITFFPNGAPKPAP